MKTSLYDYLRKYEILRYMYKESIFSFALHKFRAYQLYAYYKFKTIKEYLTTIPRRLGYRDPNFLPLLNLKNKYQGKRCFIVCTGPSLTIDDLEKLENEYVFGMNSLCLIHDKTKWKPDFFGMQDESVYERVKETFLKTDNGQVFLPYSMKKYFKGTNFNYIPFPILGSYHLYEAYIKGEYLSKFSQDAYIAVYDGFTITHSLLQLAVYMGFDEIYLLGADCNYLGDKQHFIEHGHVPNNLDITTKRLISTYIVTNEFAAKNNIKIYNATRGGKLEVFPRVELDDVLVNSKKNKRHD